MKLFSKGDEADSMFIIEYGKVKVEIDDPVYLGWRFFWRNGFAWQRNEMRPLQLQTIQNYLN